MRASNKVRVRRITAMLSSGAKVHIPAWVVDSATDGPRLLLVAAQHGNEVQGCEAIRRFVELASRRPMRGTLFAVPVANLQAFHERRPHIHLGPEQAYDDDRGHNMNRTWPGRRNGNDTARVSYAIYRAFGAQATHALDLHTWEGYAAPGVLIQDRPDLRQIAAKLGHRFVHVGGDKTCMLSGYFCSTGRVGVTYEFCGQYAVDEDQVRRGLRVVVNFAKVIGLLAGPLMKGDEPIVFTDQVDMVRVKAPLNGLFVGRNLALCDWVEKGTMLGHVLSDRDLRCHEIKSPVAGYLRTYGASRAKCDVALPGHHPYVEKGERLASVWRPKD